jgi:hypothetical protein
MRFHYGAIPESSDFQPGAEGWRAISEPNPAAVQFLAIPIMIFFFLLWGLFVFLFVLPKPIDLHMATTVNSISSSLWALALLILLIPLHEFLHALAHPHLGSSSDTISGLLLLKRLLNVSLLGSVLPSGEFLGVGVVLFHIPHSTIVRNKGWKTYWKLDVT